MRPQRGRKKKLIVAFHFQFARQAAWRCDACRKQGLERKRRCGFVPGAVDNPERLVWARGPVRLTCCPVSLVMPQSQEYLELWHVARLFGFGDTAALPARTVDAFCVLENESAMERNHDER